MQSSQSAVKQYSLPNEDREAGTVRASVYLRDICVCFCLCCATEMKVKGIRKSGYVLKGFVSHSLRSPTSSTRVFFIIIIEIKQSPFLHPSGKEPNESPFKFSLECC